MYLKKLICVPCFGCQLSGGAAQHGGACGRVRLLPGREGETPSPPPGPGPSHEAPPGTGARLCHIGLSYSKC